MLFSTAAISSCSFNACRFINCTFSHVSINGTTLTYARFIDCAIDYEIITHNLPNEPNLREELCRNLKVEFAKLGNLAEARLFRLEEIRAKEANLRNAILWKTDWYKRHYYGIRRVRAGVELVWSSVNRYLWGYGERLYVLVSQAVLFSLIILPFLFWLVKSGLRSAELHWGDYIYLSLQTMLSVDLCLRVTPMSLGAEVVTVLGSLLGLVFAGLFVAYLLRWILRR